MNPNDPTQPHGYPGPGGYPPPPGHHPQGQPYQAPPGGYGGGYAPPPGYHPPGQPYQVPPGGYGSPYAPARSGKGVILWVILGVIVAAIGVAGYMFWPESEATIARRSAEERSARRAVMSDSYLTEDYWCDSRGGRVHFRGGIYQTASFYDRNRRLISEPRFTLSGNQLTLTGPNGSMVATVTRVDVDTMTMTMQGRTETVNHCG